jgi:hypothetical protein
VRFQVLTAARVKMAVFWLFMHCRMVKFADVLEVLASSIIGAIISDFS